MSKHVVGTTPTGFNVTPSPEAIERDARELRMKDRKANPKATITNKDVMDMLLDMAARQEELYDLLKQK